VAALYVGQGSGGPPGPAWDQTGLQIQADGSLTLLPSSPESAINGSNFAVSPTLPIAFPVANQTGNLESLLVNPDHSLSLYSSIGLLPAGNSTYRLSVDPTGSNLYLPGAIDTSGTIGVTIFPTNGALQPLSTIAIPNITSGSAMAFTPDGGFAFVSTCSTSNQGSVLSYSRSSNGMLTPGPVYVLPVGTCSSTPTVSPDGRYFAESEATQGQEGDAVQIYSIASDDSLTAVLSQPFPVTFGPGATEFAYVTDMLWDQSNSFLIFSVRGSGVAVHVVDGGVGVLSFSGTALTQTVDPIPNGTGPIWRAGSFIYVMRPCEGVICGGPVGVDGFDFQNGQLIRLVGSPFPYGNGVGMMIY
jgi:hypothetical protein